MSSEIKAIKVYGKGGPNPPKVAMVLEELDLPYEITFIPFTDVKNPEYTRINPNGRVPAIYDPNTNLTIWESGAIVLYLIDRYDTEHKISFPRGTNDAYLAQQWLFFQVSGQGPYYGQSVYFKRYHHEKVPSTEDRFNKEINRVTAVLDKYLSEQDKGNVGDGPWLVGGRFSYADLSFVNWQQSAAHLVAKEDFDPEQYPHVKAWIGRMIERTAIKKVLEENERFMKEMQAKGAH